MTFYELEFMPSFILLAVSNYWKIMNIILNIKVTLCDHILLCYIEVLIILIIPSSLGCDWRYKPSMYSPVPLHPLLFLVLPEVSTPLHGVHTYSEIDTQYNQSARSTIIKGTIYNLGARFLKRSWIYILLLIEVALY